MTEAIGPAEIEWVPLSASSGTGRVFRWRGRLMRAVPGGAEVAMRALIDSGLIEELVRTGLVPRTWIADAALKGYAMVLEHEEVRPVSYPCEWSFGMLQDAAIALLRVNSIARRYGYQTRDAHPMNIVFDGPAPRFVDIGSFIKTGPRCRGWVAYEQFVRYFHYPLLLWRRVGGYVARRMLIGGQPVPHANYLRLRWPALSLLPGDRLERIVRAWHRFRRLSDATPERIRSSLPGVGWFVAGLAALELVPFQSVDFASLEKRIARLRCRPERAPWSDYQRSLQVTDGGRATPRFERIADIVGRLHVDSALEIAGNQGVLSRLLLTRGAVGRVTCTDRDEQAIDRLYRSVRRDRLPVSPAVLDLVATLPTVCGEPATERFRADAVIALALTHHLLLSDGIDVEFVLASLARYTRRYALVEFMPLGLYDRGNAPPIPDWYTADWFRLAFQRHFRLLQEESLEPNRLLFVGEL